MSRLTLAIAIVGAVTGVVSLAWNIIEFGLTGGRARAELVGAWIGQTGALTFPAERFSEQTAPTGGYDQRTLGVRVRSKRAAIKVTSAYVGLSHGIEAHVPQGYINTALPHRLEAHDTETWFVNFDAIQAAVGAIRDDDHRRSTKLFAAFSLASGKTVVSKRYDPRELGIDIGD